MPTYPEDIRLATDLVDEYGFIAYLLSSEYTVEYNITVSPQFMFHTSEALK